uniref:Serpentine Receptor, class T n=1 Tax=Rhabditophanes sp. KR3021 TaxID=114890 RepID=A0AC35TNT2_9BILA
MFTLSSAFIREHYSCHQQSDEEWAKNMVPNKMLGICYFSLGLFFQILYIPSICALSNWEFRKYSCYKIMISLAYLDVITICFNALLTGFLTYQGAVYCTHPNLIYFSGVFALACWTAACFLIILLGFSRFIDVWKPRLSSFLFDGYKTWFYLPLAALYGLYFALFTSPVIFTSHGYAWFFDPYVAIEGNYENGYIYSNYSHFANNVAIIVLLTILYILFFIVLFWRYSLNSSSKEMSTMQHSLFLQSSIICSVTFIASVIYVMFNFVAVPESIVILGQITWILSHSISSAVLIIFNKSVRRYILLNYMPKSFKILFISNATVTVIKSTNNTNNPPPVQIPKIIV